MQKMVLLAAALTAAVAVAQDVPIPYSIESEGIATVDAAPTYAEFWLTATITGETVAAAMKTALDFEPNLRQEMETRELRPSVISVGSAAIPDIQTKQVRISARVQFSATTFTTAENGPDQFAALCDKMLDAAKTLQAQVTGPILGVDDPVAIQQTAVQRALEKAYPSAKAAADSMNGQITAVGRVNIVSITWNDTAGSPAGLPDTRRMTCTAKVRVSYIFSSTG